MSFWRRIRNIFRRPSAPAPAPKPQDPVKPTPITPSDVFARIWTRASAEFGISELSGSKHNPRIIEYHMATSLKASEDEVPWCASFVSWVLEKEGVPSTKSAWARSYLQWGVKLDKPVKGCVVVLSRGADPSTGHVGFYSHESDSRIYLLGGNQGNSVNISGYAKSRLLGYRGPKA